MSQWVLYSYLIIGFSLKIFTVFNSNLMLVNVNIIKVTVKKTVIVWKLGLVLVD